MAATDTLKSFLKNNQAPLVGAAAGAGMGALSLPSKPLVVPDEGVSIDKPFDQSDAQRSGTIGRDPSMAPAPEGSWKDRLAQGVSMARDVGNKAVDVGADLLSQGKQLGRQGLEFAGEHPVAVGAAGVGTAALLGYLLNRKRKGAKVAAAPLAPGLSRGAGKMVGQITSHATNNPVSTAAATALTGGLAAGAFSPKPLPAAPVAPLPPVAEPGLVDRGLSALGDYKDNLLAGDPATVGWTGAGIGAAGILTALMMHRHERDADEE